MALQTLILVLVSVSVTSQGAQAEKSNPEFYGISRHTYTSSEICRRCHKDIFDVWKKSMHSKSIEDPVFMADFIMVQLKRGKDLKPYCLSCHAPTTMNTKDYDLHNTISNEGVTCDFCHSVTKLGLPGESDYYKIETGAKKYGPFRDAESPAHETEYSENHTKSEFCAGCHQLVNSNGVVVMGTYSEWKESPYAQEGIQCQNCHMPIVYDMNVVDPSIKESSHFVTAHEFRGGHSMINLTHAATIETEVTQDDNVATVMTRITNSESGHKLPTGTPARKVVLNTRILDKGGNLLAEVNKVFRKVLVDEDGVIIEDNAGMILDAVQIFSDNRIAPKETRVEIFKFDIPKGVDYFTVENTLQYEFSMPVLRTEKVVYQMARNVVEAYGNRTHAQKISAYNTQRINWGFILFICILTATLLSIFYYGKRKTKAESSVG